MILTAVCGSNTYGFQIYLLGICRNKWGCKTGRSTGYGAERFKLLEKHNVWILGALVGNITFICIFGVHVLNVTYTDWLLGGGDITQNYLGWCFSGTVTGFSL